MKSNDFITNHNIDCTTNRISILDIPIFESAIDIPFGNQLKQYLLTYGYLGYGHIEFLGINNKLMTKSDMITTTIYLHENFPKTENFIAIEVYDGEYYLVDKNDNVFRYLSSRNELMPLGTKLFEHIINRFSTISET